MINKFQQKIINIDLKDKNSLLKNIDLIANLLNENKVLVLPTKTIYGISARFDNAKNFERIYEIKKRSQDMPFIILISNLGDLGNLVLNLPKNAQKLIEDFWEKDEAIPLTIIFKKNPKLAGFITGNKETIGVRRAEFDFIRKIIDKSAPLISTSATISGVKSAPLEITDIPQSILNDVDAIIKYPEKLLGIESTIVDFSKDEECPSLVRQGAVPYKYILQKLGIKI